MYLCYLDESGVPEIPGNSTHFVLAGLAIPIERWREADAAISEIMARYGLAGAELHTAWLLRKYLEQSKIDDFADLSWDERRTHVTRLRVVEVHRVRKLGIAKRNSQLKKVYRHTDPYIHLTYEERNRLAVEIAEAISKWDWAVLIGSCIDKSFFLTKNKPNADLSVNTFAFTQLVIYFAALLEQAENHSNIGHEFPQSQHPMREFGLLIHDNNPTVALKHTRQLRVIQDGAVSAGLKLFERIIETPLFVDSSLTRMIQLGDLCAYSLRRYVENGETNLFSVLYGKGRRTTSGIENPIHRFNIQHFTEPPCQCLICAE
ncbi:MAG: DUF3800 domain-containing protein [Terracidiphilus sp.]|jgi:hypothetical protein